MILPAKHANFMLSIAMGRAPTGVPVPYDKDEDDVAVYLEKFGLIERHHVGNDKVGACFTKAGAEVFAAILAATKP